MKRRRCLLRDPPPRSALRAEFGPPPQGGRLRAHERHRRVRCQALGQHHRARPRPAAAVRRREGLVQVDVHGVDAEVARPHLADDGVEVRAVAVEIRPGLVQRLRDLDDLRLEQAAGVRVRQHDRRDVGSEQRAHVVDMDPAIVPDRHRLHGEADQRRGRRIGAVRRIRHQHRPARIALALGGDRRLDRHHAEKLAMGAGLRRERNGRHAGQRREIAGELAHELERALHGRDRLQGMDVAEAGQPRHALVEAGIVLHGAGAERKQPGVDAEVLLRQAHVMAHGLGLGEAGQADVALALEPAEARRERAPARRDRRRSRRARPISKISGSSCCRARLPVKVGCSAALASSAPVGRPWRFSIQLCH